MIVTDTFTPEINGIVTSVVTFSDLLAKRGHKIMIVAPKYNGHKDKRQKGITIVRYPAISFATNKETRVSFPRIIDLFIKLRRFKPDLIHIQTPSNLGNVGIAMAKAFRIPNIQTYHTYLPELAVYFDTAKAFGLDKIIEAVDSSRFTKRIMDSDFYDLLMREKKPESLSRFMGLGRKGAPKYKLTIRMLWTYTRWVYNRANLVLTPTETLGNLLKKHGIKSSVATQTNGIWLEKFQQKSRYVNSGKIIHYGRLGFEKRADVVIDAFAKAQEKLPYLKLDIIGDGPARKSLEKQVQKMGLSESVRFLGFVKRDKIEKTLKDYELFLTASPMETQGMVVLESLACGVPVIGVNKLAVPEIVKNGLNGFVVPAGNASRMAQKIVKVMEDSGLRVKLGKNGIKSAEAHRMTTAVEKLEHNYQSVIGK